MSEAVAASSGNDPATPSGTPATAPAAEAAGTGNQATQTPANTQRDQYRSAIDRLQKGETAAQINATLAKGAATPKTSPAAQATTATAKAPPAAQASAAEADTRGLTAPELNALKRGGMTDEDIKTFPATNLKSWARKLQTSQSNADREYQAAKQGKQPGSAPAAATGAMAQANGQQAPAAGDPAAEEQAAGESDPATQEPGNRELMSTGEFFTPLPPMDAATRKTLVDYGGEEYAKQMEASQQHAFQHFTKSMAPVIRALNGMAGMMEESHWTAAMADLKAQPGYENLTDEQKTSVREKASHLLRASDQPLTKYGMREAAAEAARVVLNVNVQQNAQAALLKQRETSLNGQPDKGSQRTTPSVTKLDGRGLTREVARLMGTGLSAGDARKKLEADGVV